METLIVVRLQGGGFNPHGRVRWRLIDAQHRVVFDAPEIDDVGKWARERGGGLGAFLRDSHGQRYGRRVHVRPSIEVVRNGVAERLFPSNEGGCK